jgi:hypothetical protein
MWAINFCNINDVEVLRYGAPYFYFQNGSLENVWTANKPRMFGNTKFAICGPLTTTLVLLIYQILLRFLRMPNVERTVLSKKGTNTLFVR